jgi:hydroxypyruvate reductase
MVESLSQYADLKQTLVITKHSAALDILSATLIESGHPVPDSRSQAAGEVALKFVSGLEEDDVLICLISGGGSALMTAPTLPLEDLQMLTSALLACGARIDEINTLRRHLDRVKGGGVAKATRARVLSLILSDVVNSPLEAIASGPTAPDPTTKNDAVEILEKYRLANSLPATTLSALKANPETPKPGDPIYSRVENVIVGDNAFAVQTAIEQAEREGFHSEYLGSDWEGEARVVGIELARKLRVTAQSRPGPFCLVGGGETTVTIQGDGKGGRNQELALAAVPELAGLENALLLTLASDGEDGPTDAAGAVVSGESRQRAETLGLDVADHLSRNDAYPFFDRLNDLFRIGPTGTNVNDLIFLIGL